MKRLVVKDGQDSGVFEMLDEALLRLGRGEDEVVHVPGGGAVGGDGGLLDAGFFGPFLQTLMVILPDGGALGLNVIPGFQLGQEKRSQQVGGKIAGADVDPGIFVDLAAEKAARLVPFSRMISARSKRAGSLRRMPRPRRR